MYFYHRHGYDFPLYFPHKFLMSIDKMRSKWTRSYGGTELHKNKHCDDSVILSGCFKTFRFTGSYLKKESVDWMIVGR